MRALRSTPQGIAVSARRRLALAALAFFLLPWPASALDRARITAGPEPGRPEAYVVRLDDDTLMFSRWGDLARIQRLRDSLAGNFLWMRHEGREHIFQDPDLLAQIDQLWSQGDEVLLREESELAEGRGARLKEQKQDIARRRAEIRREQDRVFRENSRLSDEHSVLFWRQHHLNIELVGVEDEEYACRLQQEIDELEQQLRDLGVLQEEKERERVGLNGRMEELDLEERALTPEEDAIWKARREIDGRRNELLRTLDATLLRLLEQTIEEQDGVAPTPAEERAGPSARLDSDKIAGTPSDVVR